MNTLSESEQLFRINKLHDQGEVVKRFFNKMQRNAMAISANNEYYVCARGTGKSEGLDARFIIRNVWSMPGSMGALISPTYAKAWANTLPAICHALGAWGYQEGVHYVVGRKAPDNMGFKLPKRKPLSDAWGNCIHFWNGTILVVLSFSQGMSANSMSLDWVLGPEAKFLSYEKIKSEVVPANRGNRQYFDYSPWHHSVMYTTDMPTTKGGRWILEKEKEMDAKHINFIRNIYRDLVRRKSKPEEERTDYDRSVIRELTRDLSLARKYQRPKIQKKGKTREYTVMFGMYDVFDNMEVLGKDFIWQMYRDSPALVWRTAFCNEMLVRVENGFYSSLHDGHFYLPPDPGNMHAGMQLAGCMKDGDLDFSAPLHIAFDANAAISSCAIGQPDFERNRMKTINSFFVKTPMKLTELCDKVCEYYKYKMNKSITFYYDQTFVWTTATMKLSYADTIIKAFKSHGWRVTDVYIGLQPTHEFRHQEINKSLNGQAHLYPVFNDYNNEVLRLALEQAGVKTGKNGFEKDKTPESLPDTPEHPAEYATHITDAFDTLWVGMNLFFKEGSSGSGGGIITM